MSKVCVSNANVSMKVCVGSPHFKGLDRFNFELKRTYQLV